MLQFSSYYFVSAIVKIFQEIDYAIKYSTHTTFLSWKKLMADRKEESHNQIWFFKSSIFLLQDRSLTSASQKKQDGVMITVYDCIMEAAYFPTQSVPWNTFDIWTASWSERLY